LLKEILTLHPVIRRGSPGRKGLPVSHEVESEVGSLRGGVREIAGEIGKRYKILIFTDEADTIERRRPRPSPLDIATFWSGRSSEGPEGRRHLDLRPTEHGRAYVTRYGPPRTTRGVFGSIRGTSSCSA
jgi:hypothetical protein